MGRKTRKNQKTAKIKSKKRIKSNQVDEDFKLISESERKIWTGFYAMLFFSSIIFLLVYLAGLIKILVLI